MFHKHGFVWRSFRYLLTSILISFSSLNPIEKTTAQNSNSPKENMSKSSSNFKLDYRLDSTEIHRPHYVINPMSTKKLALWEEALVKNLIKIISSKSILTQNDPCYLNLQNYLREFHKDIKPNIKSNQRAKLITENPILIFRMIRRIVVDLQHDIKLACLKSLPEIVRAIKWAYKKNMTPATSQDFDDALLGMLRIHFIYGFNSINETRLGIFNGVKTGASLSHEDCLALANKAIDIEAYRLAYQWLVSASLTAPQNAIKLDYPKNETCMTKAAETNEIFCFDSKEDSEYSRLWIKLLNSANIERPANLEEIFKDNSQMQIKENFYNYSKYATCRGENSQTIQERSKLICYYTKNSNPYFYINPIKTEMLSRDPLILRFYELISNKIIKAVLSWTAKRMIRSAVLNPTNQDAEFTTYRTSVNGWIQDTENRRGNKKLLALNRKSEKLTGLQVLKSAESYLQVAMYGSLGGHYDFHYDACQAQCQITEHQGDRFATLLYFLSDVKMGGYTAFPNVGIFAKPIKGSAIFWYNLYRNGTKDMRLEHGGCPVILGTKQVANRWFFESENMLRHPCLIDPMA